MSKYSDEIASLQGVCNDAGSSWGAINPESAARMRLQNRFRTGLEIAQYTADIMRRDMEEYDADSSQYTQSLGCWHGFIGQQKMISIKKHFGSNKKKYLYLSGWMVAALRSEFGPLPDQSMHEKTAVSALIEELYTFLKQADARELGGLFRELGATLDELGEAQHGPEWLVQLVGNTGRESTHRCQFFCVKELFFNLPMFCIIPGNRQDCNRTVFSAIHRERSILRIKEILTLSYSDLFFM